MDYYKLHHSKGATKSKRGMGFFGSKNRKRSSSRGQQQASPASGGGEVEARTDVNRKDGQAKGDSGLREIVGGPQHQQQQQQQQQQQPATPKAKSMRALLKSPTSRSSDRDVQAPSPRGSSRHISHRSTDSGSTTHSNLQNQSPRNAEKRTMASSPKLMPDPRVPSPRNQPTATAASAAAAVTGPAKAKSPPSILHRHSHFTQTSPTSFAAHRSPPPTTNYDFASSPAPASAHKATYDPRVRFMSSGESVASTEASGVHLMAGGGNSVASSSAMSSSHDRENVFDRVLNMVMAEEHERLNAMGMSATPDPKSDAARSQQHQQQRRRRSNNTNNTNNNNNSNDRFHAVDAKARAVVASLDSKSGSDDDLGLLPPRRSELSPIDMDTGLEIGEGLNEAPIDMDTGMEIAYHEGNDECEYHDHNDDEVEEERWKRLNNEAALMGGMKGLSMEDGKRCRSYDSSRQMPPVGDIMGNHHRYGSDPEKLDQRRNSSADVVVNGKSPNQRGDYSPGQVGAKTMMMMSKQSPSTSRGGSGSGSNGGKKKKFWDRNSKQDFETDEWVAFGRRSPSGGRVDDTAAF